MVVRKIVSLFVSEYDITCVDRGSSNIPLKRAIGQKPDLVSLCLTQEVDS